MLALVHDQFLGWPGGQSSVITHTWVKEGTLWKLLGGMSGEIK
jgi:hypothetical protein